MVLKEGKDNLAIKGNYKNNINQKEDKKIEYFNGECNSDKARVSKYL